MQKHVAQKKMPKNGRAMMIEPGGHQPCPRSIAFCLSIMLFCSVLLTGCWDRREVNDIGFVIAMSIDKEGDGKYRLAVQVPLVSSLGGPSGEGGGTSGDKSFYVDSAVGKTIREAYGILQSRMSRLLYFAHYRVVILGEELARNGLSNPLDIVTRFPEHRLTSFVVITKGKGMDLLSAQPQFERFSGEALRELVKSVTIPVSMKDLAQMANHKGLDPFLPVFEPVQSHPKGKSKEVEAMGVAVFRKDKLIKILSRSDSVGLRWFQRYFNPFSMIVKLNSNEWINTEVLRGETKIRPVIKQGRVHYDIHLKSSIVITENMTTLNFDNENSIDLMEKRVSEEIENKIKIILEHSKATKSDPIGLGMVLARHHPKTWKTTYRDKWRDELPDITYTIHSKVQATNIGQTTNNIMKEDPRE
ncbi:Ger(x)C family spore germination protein [Brevibacillus invocatus]